MKKHQGFTISKNSQLSRVNSQKNNLLILQESSNKLFNKNKPQLKYIIIIVV